MAAGLDHDLFNLLKNENNLRKSKRLIVRPDLKNTEQNRWINKHVNDIGLVELWQPFEFGSETNIMPGM